VKPSFDARADFLRVFFAGAAPGQSGPEHADFHWFWLRHQCDCCRHELTRERTLRPSDVPLDITPRSVALSPDFARLFVVWPEGAGEHPSDYALDWLRANAYAPDAAEIALPPSDTSAVELHARAFESREALAREAVARVGASGAVLVRGAGLDTEAWIDAFVAQALRVIPTHFGRIEDLRTDNTTNQNTDQLGYTDADVDLHTDQPFLAEPPRFQMLHCMRAADAGGDNAVADARAAAEYLRRVDRPAFDLLSSVPIRFHRVQKQFEKLHVSPLFEVDSAGRLRRVRSSYFTMAPQQLDFARMEAWYRAYQRFERLIGEPACQYRFALAPGDFLLYDNWRMLHARTGFRGARWVRGVYFDPAAAA
jgi:gamma-butyrobetaine dioxygenase/trimethyllysine dioxygenase